MPTIFIAYAALVLAIVSEVTGSAFLQKSEQFTKLGPTVAMAAFYLISFFFLSQSLKVLSLGVAYAIWAASGIALTALVGFLVFKQDIDLWGVIGIAMIIGGVVIINTLSSTATH